jgi:hypothetical protein
MKNNTYATKFSVIPKKPIIRFRLDAIYIGSAASEAADAAEILHKHPSISYSPVSAAPD